MKSNNRFCNIFPHFFLFCFILAGLLSCTIESHYFPIIKHCIDGPSLATKPNYDDNRLFMSNYTYYHDYGGHAGHGDLMELRPNPNLEKTVCPSAYGSLFYVCDGLSVSKDLGATSMINIMISNIEFKYHSQHLDIVDELTLTITDESEGMIESQQMPIDTISDSDHMIDGKKEWVQENDFYYVFPMDYFDVMGDKNPYQDRTVHFILDYKFKDDYEIQNDYVSRRTHIINTYSLILEGNGVDGVFASSLSLEAKFEYLETQ